MPFFSRLTDIVTCNLSSLLSRSEDPEAALEEIIREMQEGLAGAQRCTRTACDNVGRLETEIGSQHQEAQRWLTEAREALSRGAEEQARSLLLRKHEVEDLIAGLEQQLHAAISTRDHLRTTQHALEARLAEARRRRCAAEHAETRSDAAVEEQADRVSRVDAELAELRRQLEG